MNIHNGVFGIVEDYFETNKEKFQNTHFIVTVFLVYFVSMIITTIIYTTILSLILLGIKSIQNFSGPLLKNLFKLLFQSGSTPHLVILGTLFYGTKFFNVLIAAYSATYILNKFDKMIN